MIERIAELWRRIIYYLHRRRFDRELREEMEFHLEMETTAGQADGLGSREARRAARRQFGNQTLLQEVSREVWAFRSIEALGGDLKYAARLMVRRPGFAVAAVATLAAGIGLNSAIFSVINSYLLRPMPYQDPDRLVQVWETDSRGGNDHRTVAPANFLDWSKQAASFESISAYNIDLPALEQPSGAVQIGGAVVSTNFFDTLAVTPSLGRTFEPGEDQPGKNRVVIISDGFWRNRLGGAGDVIGQTLTLSSTPCTIIGVLPPGYRHPEPLFDQPAEVWRPLKLSDNRKSHYLRAIGRLKPGVSVENAQAEMTGITAQLEAAYPATNRDDGVKVLPLQKQFTGELRLPLLILQGAVALVLLIACVNIAGLLLARITGRGREIAIRAALGAGKPRITRMLLTESLLLAAIGGAAGLGVAFGGVSLLTSFAPHHFNRLGAVNLDNRVLAFTVLSSLLTVIIFGLAPAFQAASTDINSALKEGGTAPRGKRIRGSLVIAEIALALVLLTGAGLMLRSLARLQAVPLGFNPENLVTMHVDLPRAKTGDDKQTVEFFNQILDTVASLPAVQSAALTSSLPLDGLDNTSGGFTIEGQSQSAPGKRSDSDAGFRMVSPGYFHTMEIPVLRGRDFTITDTKDSPPVVVINDTLARRYFEGDDPIGRRIVLESDSGKSREIVGVVGDFKYEGLALPVGPETYIPHAQNAWGFMALAVRTSSRAEAMTTTVENSIWGFANDVALSRVKTMGQILSAESEWTRFYLLLLGIFALVAVALAAVGIYAVMSYTVSQSTREIGIRMAMGARAADVLGLVIRRGTLLMGIGLALGLAGAVASTRIMKVLLFSVSATDVVTFSASALLLAAIALLACYLPARRAARVDPMTALRCE